MESDKTFYDGSINQVHQHNVPLPPKIASEFIWKVCNSQMLTHRMNVEYAPYALKKKTILAHMN